MAAPRSVGREPRVNHSPLMDLVHWLGVALALPATAMVLHASWRAYLGGKPDDT
jgi:hypothetical protein